MKRVKCLFNFFYEKIIETQDNKASVHTPLNQLNDDINIVAVIANVSNAFNDTFAKWTLLQTHKVYEKKR